MRFELVAPLEIGELVGPEVDAAVHDRPGLERPRDVHQRLGHALDERLLVTALEEQAGVYPAQCVGDHELGPQQANAVHGEGGHLFGVLGEGQVDIDPGGQRSGSAQSRCGGGGGRGHHCRRRHGSFGHRAVATVDRDELAVAQYGRGVAGAHDGRHSELARDDRGVAGHAPAIGDHRRRPAHGGHPVRAGHGRHEDLAGLQAVALVGRLQHPHDTGRPARRGGQALDQDRTLVGPRDVGSRRPTAVTGRDWTRKV